MTVVLTHLFKLLSFFINFLKTSSSAAPDCGTVLVGGLLGPSLAQSLKQSVGHSVSQSLQVKCLMRIQVG